MKILIATSGGGHFSPALSVIEKLPKETEILLLGRKYALEGDKAFSIEYQTAKKLGIAFKPITAGRLQRKFTTWTVPSLFKIPVGFFQAFNIIRGFWPDVVLSFGGYVSLPVVIASFLLGKPVVIHEQTLDAGLSNKLAAIFAKKICVSWESSKKLFPKGKVVLTGNPIRSELLEDSNNSSYVSFLKNIKLPLIYVTGGSTGSHALNIAVEGCIEKLVEKYAVVHQTGDSWQYKDFDRLSRVSENLKEKDRYIITKFIDAKDVGFLLRNCDLVVSRSGINTVTELLFFEKKAILVPLPHGQNNEQLKNARFLEKKGLAEILPQENLSAESLYSSITSFISKKMEKTISKEEVKLHQNAAEFVVKVVSRQSTSEA